jgi:two-component system, NarL family, response regulator DevR
MTDNGSHSIRILIIDDRHLTRQGIHRLLEAQPDFSVVGAASDRQEALLLARQSQPDVMLLELELEEDENSLNLLPELRASAPLARIIIYTSLRDTETHQRAIRRGAVGLVLKQQLSKTLIKAIRKVHAGEAWLDRRFVASLIAATRWPSQSLASDDVRFSTLTPREREVCSLLVTGLKNRQIAERLFISEITVRNHMASASAKMGATNRFELALVLYRCTLLAHI